MTQDAQKLPQIDPALKRMLFSSAYSLSQFTSPVSDPAGRITRRGILVTIQDPRDCSVMNVTRQLIRGLCFPPESSCRDPVTLISFAGRRIRF